MSRGVTVLAACVTVAVSGTLIVPVSHYLVWNASASIPIGLYAIRGRRSLQVDERAAIEPPPQLRSLMARRGYLPAGIPLLKRIAATSGQRVCRFHHGVTIDGQLAGVARARDRRGRSLPVWFGCRTLQHGEIFVMNPAQPDSFDGRYFGPLDAGQVIGRAVPIWTDERGDGRHVWFARPQQIALSKRSEGE